MIDQILEALGAVGSTVDKLGPRPLRGLLSGKPRELMSIIPFSDALDITDPKDISSGRDITNNFGITAPDDKSLFASALGIGAEAIADPVGLAGGLYAGAKLGGGLLDDVLNAPRRGFMTLDPFPGASRAVNEAADHWGPRYGENNFDLIGASKALQGELPRKLMENGQLPRIMNEIPPGSTPLGKGGQALVLRAPGTKIAPDGWAIRVSPSVDTLQASSGEEFMNRNLGMGPIFGRPDIPEMLQPFRSQDFGFRKMLGQNGVRVEHLPLVNPVQAVHKDLLHRLSSTASTVPESVARPYADMFGRVRQIDESMKDHIRQRVAYHNNPNLPVLQPFDVNLRNLAFMPGQEGRMSIMDGGSVGGFMSSLMPLQSTKPPDPEVMRQAFKLGAPGKTREAMELAAGRYKQIQGIPYPNQLAMPGRRFLDNPYQQRQDLVGQIEEFIRKYGGSPADAMMALAGNSGTTSQTTPLMSVLTGRQ